MIQIRVLHERAAAEVHDHGDAEDHQNRPSRGNASHTLSTYPQISKALSFVGLRPTHRALIPNKAVWKARVLTQPYEESA